MRIGFCQFAPVFGEPQTNRRTVAELIQGVQADLIVLPELFSTGYQFTDRAETASLSEPADGPTTQWAADQAKKIGGLLCGGFAERDGDRLYNSAFLAGPDGLKGCYRKLHLFNREKLCFDPGGQQPQVHDVAGVKVGIMICFDWIFPETMRIMALKGALVVCHPSNLVLPYCQESMKTRCLENMVFAVTSNRIGSEARLEGEEFTFTGGSQITAPMGKVLAKATADGVGVTVVEIDPGEARNKAVNPYNDLMADRRPDLYGPLTQRKP